MGKRKQYPLRIDPEVWDAILKWAADDMRSANAQVEFILRKALRDAGRLPTPREGDGVVVEYTS
ncbi:MAG: Arc family DNA binding domain-containing protein [Coriobacteriales bacterium]|nr:Arc family DNA binding domain-containing protein [Coriobacteriales bacterium]